MLNKVELFVAGFDGEVIAGRFLIGAFGSKRGIGEDDVETVGRGGIVDGVAEDDFGFDAVEIEIHQGEAPGAFDEFLAAVDGFFDAFGDVAVEGAAFGGFHQPFISGDEKPAGSAGGIADSEIGFNAGIGLETADNGLNQHTRGEVLPGAFLPFAGGLFE